MVFVEGGSFLMGSDDGNQDQRPSHRAQVSRFRIDATEVTVKAYSACVAAKKCAQPHAGLAGCNWMQQGRDEHPMNCVNWGEATSYCGLFGKRLPTETEWEYAARGSQNRSFAWGSLDPSPRLLNGCGAECPPYAHSLGLTDFEQTYSGDDGWPGTAPVGSFPRGDTPSGVHDLVGNVWEWTASHYCPYTNRACQATQLVARGSSWQGFQPSWSPVTGRLALEPGRREIDVGFRCVSGGSPSEASAQVPSEAGTAIDCNCNGDLMCLMHCQQQTSTTAPSAPPSATPTSSSGSSAPFNMSAAKTSLDAIASGVQSCKQVDSDGIDGPAGAGRAVVMFSSSGDAASVNLSPPFSGTPTGNCISARFRGVHVPPFAGESFSVSKSFTVE
jgi:formylglycine-generating enzyme required for sulfatase activity